MLFQHLYLIILCLFSIKTIFIFFLAHRASKKRKWPFRWDFSHRQRRSLDTEVTIQLLVVVDKEMISFHGNESVEEYVLTVMNMVGKQL